MKPVNATRKFSITLIVFAIGAASLVLGINRITKPIIGKQLTKLKERQIAQLLGSINYDNTPVKECYLSYNYLLGDPQKVHKLYVARQHGKIVAVVTECTALGGYAGPIQLLVGSDLHGRVLGVRVLNHQETPSLGDQIELQRSNWILKFNDKQVSRKHDKRWSVRKDGGDFDEFSGATITPRAVVTAVEQAARYVLLHHKDIMQLPLYRKYDE